MMTCMPRTLSQWNAHANWPILCKFYVSKLDCLTPHIPHSLIENTQDWSPEVCVQVPGTPTIYPGIYKSLHLLLFCYEVDLRVKRDNAYEMLKLAATLESKLINIFWVADVTPGNGLNE